MKKLTRQASILLFAGVFLLLIGFGLFFIKDSLFEKEVSQQDYKVEVVAESRALASIYVDSIAVGKNTEGYSEQEFVIEKGTKILDYTISQNQTFKRYVNFYGPNGTDVLTDKSKQIISHYAYSMLLTGDIIEKTNIETNEVTYEITNARITYNRIPIVLLANSNSVCLRNTEKNKEKIIKLQEFIDALNSVENRSKMISWK